MKFIKQISGVPGSGKGKIVFLNGAVSTDLKCGSFFMMMQDKDATLEEAKAYAKIGPLASPGVDWDEINRILASFS